MKSHIPEAIGKWEVVSANGYNEARITWSDGWKDVLRTQQSKDPYEKKHAVMLERWAVASSAR